MNVEILSVNNLFESIVSAGLPMEKEYDPAKYKQMVEAVKEGVFNNCKDNGRLNRARILAKTEAPGHNNFLKGIGVMMNVTASNAWFIQAERYVFFTPVSSMSKMHRITAMKLDKSAFHPATDERCIAILNEMVEQYKGDPKNFEKIIYSCPLGLQLTCTFTTNYLCLKNIFVQRCNHRLKEWIEFCETIKQLPLAKDLILPATYTEPY